MTTDLDRHVTRLTTAGVARAYKLGSVPASPAYPYAVLSLSTGSTRARTLDMNADRLREIVAQFFGRTDDSVRDLAALADEAFDGVTLDDIADEPTATREIGTSPYRDPDDQGVLNILHTYRY